MDWPSELQCRPIEVWPTVRTRPEDRRASPFKSSLSATVALLRRELDALRGIEAWTELAVRPEELRLDGRPRAHARPEHPGIVLVFHSLVLVRDLRYASDRFGSWQDNLRAIALGLEALRKVERYGIAERGEQYAGWAQLPAGDRPSAERGRNIIARLGGVRAALRATHPDTRQDGYDDTAYLDVLAAKEAAA